MSAPIICICPNCNKKLKLKNKDKLGKRVPCPGCKEPFIVKAQKTKAKPKPADDDEWMYEDEYSDDYEADNGDAYGDDYEDDYDDYGEDYGSEPDYGSPSPPIVSKSNKKKSKKSKSGSNKASSRLSPDGMNYGFFGWVVGGSLGGFVGALIWAFIVYLTSREIGWIAWGVGFLVGLGVRITAGMNYGAFPGGVAAVIAIASIFFGKFLGAYMMLDKVAAELGPLTNDDMHIADIADQLIEQIESNGGSVDLPPNAHTSETIRGTYPPNIWANATKQWNETPDAEKQIKRKLQQEFLQNGRPLLLIGVFIASFGLFDLLWFGLAGMTAFKLGSGQDDD